MQTFSILNRTLIWFLQNFHIAKLTEEIFYYIKTCYNLYNFLASFTIQLINNNHILTINIDCRAVDWWVDFFFEHYLCLCCCYQPKSGRLLLIKLYRNGQKNILKCMNDQFLFCRIFELYFLSTWGNLVNWYLTHQNADKQNAKIVRHIRISESTIFYGPNWAQIQEDLAKLVCEWILCACLQFFLCYLPVFTKLIYELTLPNPLGSVLNSAHRMR